MTLFARRAEGFSLIELVIVIALLGIALSIAAPSFREYIENLNLRSAAREIASDIFVTRERAISENRKYRIRFDRDAKSYSICRRNEKDTDWEPSALAVKPLSALGRNIDFSMDDNVTLIFQTRGTVSNETIGLNGGGNMTAQIRINAAGRTYARFMQKTGGSDAD